MNGEKMGNEEGFDSYASDEWTTEDSHDRQQFAIKVECFFDDLKEKIEKKVDELSQTVEEKITIRMEELLQEMEDRISNRTSRIFAKAEEDSQIPLKKRKQYVISIDGTDNLDTPSVDHLDESNHHHSQALNERVEVLETSVNKLLQAVFPRVETSQQLPDSSKSPNTFTVDPSFVCERVPSNPPKLTTFPRTCLVRDKKCTHGTEGRLKEGNRLKQNVKGTQTSSSISKASPSFTVVKDKSTCPIKDQRLREVISSAKSHKLLTDHFEQYSSSGEESSDDIVEKEQMSTDRATISSKSPEKPREKQTGYTEMLDFQTAISGYSFSSTSVNPACSVKPRQYSNSSLPTSPTGKMCGSGSGDTSEEKSRDTPYADDTFSTMIDLSSEIVAPSQPCSREKSPVPQPSVCGLPLNSYIVVKVLSDGDTTSASEGLKNPIKEMILPIFDHPTSNTRISTVSKQKQSTKREGLVCVPPPIETLIQPEIKTNNKTEDRSNAASGTGTQSKFRIPATISSDYCRPSSTTDVMSSVSTGILPTGHLKTVVEKLVEEPRALSDTNTARRLCSGTAAHKLTQQSDRSLPSTCRTPFEDLKVQIATRKASGTLTSSNICSLSSTPSQSLPLTIPASTIERRVDQSRATRDSSQSSASHRLLSSTGRSPLTSTPVHESITDSRVDQSTALSDTSQSSTSHRLLSTTGYSSPPSSRYLESTTGRRDDPSSVLSDTSQSSNTNRPPSTGTRLSPTTSPPRVLESIIERRVDQSRALRYAAAEGRVAELRQLLADGADPDARNAEGCTVLHCAARRGMWLAINALLDAGANVHAKDRVGWTALHCAAAYDPAALCVTALAKAGADVNERSNSKLTPLHLAAKYNNEKAARALLEAGACKTIMDAHGRTPIQVTHSDLVKNLLR